MRLLVELEPTRNRGKLDAVATRLARLRCIWRVVVPDAPLGKPKASSLMLAVYLEHFGIPTLVNFRLRDLNRTAFEQLIWGAYINGIRYVLFLRGDRPQAGVDVDEVSSEEAVVYVKSERRLASSIKAGIYLSFRHPPERIIQRASRSKADFFVANRINMDREAHRQLIEQLREMGEVYAYLITAPVIQSKSLSTLLGGQPVYPIEELSKVLESYDKLGVDGVILTAPGNMAYLLTEIAEMCG